MVSKSFMDEKEGITFSDEIFWFHSAEKFVVVIPSTFQKIWGIEKFMHNRGYHNFTSKFSCLSVPKMFIGEPFCSLF